jgi:hypothetical protein
LVKGKCFRSQRKNESLHEMKVKIWQAIQIIYIVTVIFVHICKGYSCHKQAHWYQKGGGGGGCQCRACVDVLNLCTDL